MLENINLTFSSFRHRTRFGRSSTLQFFQSSEASSRCFLHFKFTISSRSFSENLNSIQPCLRHFQQSSYQHYIARRMNKVQRGEWKGRASMSFYRLSVTQVLSSSSSPPHHLTITPHIIPKSFRQIAHKTKIKIHARMLSTQIQYMCGREREKPFEKSPSRSPL